MDLLREYARKYDIKHFYDITDRSDFQANPNYKGVCHVALAQEGHAIPGEVLFGTDSHTCNAGAFGMFASGIGNTDAGFVLGTGKLLIKVPQTLHFRLVGEMPSYLLAKDLILQIIGEIGVRTPRQRSVCVLRTEHAPCLRSHRRRGCLRGLSRRLWRARAGAACVRSLQARGHSAARGAQVAGATYKAMEFSGETLAAMNMDERMTICNMAVEAGGKNGCIAPDQTTFDYVDTRAPGYDYTPQYADAGASYAQEYTIDVSKLEPLVAAPHSPDNRKTARECADVAIDRVYIGSCTGAHFVCNNCNITTAPSTAPGLRLNTGGARSELHSR